MKFSEIITTEDQYEANKARASISFLTNHAVRVLDKLPEYFDGTMTMTDLNEVGHSVGV